MLKLVLITIGITIGLYLVKWLINFVKMSIDLVKFDDWKKDHE